MTIIATEEIKKPLTRSALSKKGLCDYVVNIATGCVHGCSFCYVPSTPVIRMRQAELRDRGVVSPTQDWGSYLFLRDNIPSQLDRQLQGMRQWQATPAGKGVVLLCSTTDPYQNRRAAKITDAAIRILLEYGKRVRVLTRSPLITRSLDLLANPNITVGMSLPHFDNNLARVLEPGAPRPTDRYAALLQARAAGCRVFVAMAPTPPTHRHDEFSAYLDQILKINPEVIFWEPINLRGSNAEKLRHKVDWADSVSSRDRWAYNFDRQWRVLQNCAQKFGVEGLLHPWFDSGLKSAIEPATWMEYQQWINHPTVEVWA